MIVDAFLEESRDLTQQSQDREQIKLLFSRMDSLSFSYKRVYKIHGLRGLQSLQRLKLDNNNISKIENLDKLENLRSLDLSFNFIEKIENLGNLHLLEDLSLFHNRISQVDQTEVEPLRNLNSLSLGHN